MEVLTALTLLAAVRTAGRFTDAVNAYWSPFFSWAMVPWLALGVPPLLAAKLTVLLAAAALVLGGWMLVGVISTDRLLRGAVTLVVQQHFGAPNVA